METSMKQRSPFMRIAGVMLVLSLLLTCVISSTLAKYTSSTTGTATGKVAKWSITVNDKEATDNFTFDLFDTVDSNVKASEEEGVGIIAPGTSGQFEFVVANASEVAAKYSLDFEVDNNNGQDNIPVQFSKDGTNWVDDLSDISVANEPLGMVGSQNNTHTTTIYWRWLFDGTTQGAPAGQNDTTDTALGKAAATETTAPSLIVTANFTAEQVD